MHTNADDISRHDAFRHHRLQRLIDENGIAHGLRGRRRKDEQPSWGNDSGTKRIVAGIYEMNAHGFALSRYKHGDSAAGLCSSSLAWLTGSCSSIRPTVGTRANEQIRKQ